eukprot:gene41851-66010_t
MDEEFWTNIKGYRDYAISTYGEVENMITGRILKPRINSKNGYLYVDLYKNGKAKSYKVHRLSALNFIANPENKQVVDHIDGDKKNNNVANLRWATNQENIINSKISRNNTSGIKGVVFNKRKNKWISRITVDGAQIFLGYYTSIED